MTVPHWVVHVSVTWVVSVTSLMSLGQVSNAQTFAIPIDARAEYALPPATVAGVCGW